MNKVRVAIIGGGLGGLSAAISLAKHPQFDITLIEKNSHLGGKLNVLEKEGFSFDLGPSIFTMPQLFEKLFTMHNRKMKDYFELVPVRPHWRNFFEDGTIIDLTDKIDDMIHQDKITEKDVQELKNFYDYAERVYEFSNKTYFENQIENQWQAIKYYPAHKILKDSDYFKTMHEAITHYISNPYLIDILDYFIKYVGSSAFDAPAILNLLPYIQWKFDLWYVKDGMFNLSKGLVKLIHELNIKVMTDTEVIEIMKRGKDITSLILKDQKTIDVDLLISNMEVIPFYKKITKEDPKKIAPQGHNKGSNLNV
jgi:diapolycopene oxygenase